MSRKRGRREEMLVSALNAAHERPVMHLSGKQKGAPAESAGAPFVNSGETTLANGARMGHPQMPNV